jgi:hypothetical protein
VIAIRHTGSFLLSVLFFLAGQLFLCAQSIKLSVSSTTIDFTGFVIVRITGTVPATVDPITDVTLSESPDFLIPSNPQTETHFGGSGNTIRFVKIYELEPMHSGTMTVGPASLVVGTNKIFSNTVQVKVKQNIFQVADEHSFLLRCDPQMTTVYVGQEVPLNLRVYHNVNAFITLEEKPVPGPFDRMLYREGPDVSRKGFNDSAIRFNNQKYSGKTYYRDFIYPTGTGTIAIPGYKGKGTAYVVMQPTNDELIDRQSAMPYPFDVVSPPVIIEVKPLPEEGKPAGFTGDVGNFSISARLERNALKTNEAVKLFVTITGEGNISYTRLNDLTLPDGLQLFQPEISDSTWIGPFGMEGSKTFIYTIIPQQTGSFEIPAISYSFFDPKQGKYLTRQTQPARIEVEQGNEATARSENNLPRGFLGEKSHWKKFLLIALLVTLPLAVLVVLLLRKMKRDRAKEWARRTAEEKQRKETEERIRAEAGSVKTKIYLLMKQAELMLGQGNIQAAIHSYYEALLMAACEKCELRKEEASSSQLRYRLGVKGFSAEEIETVMSLSAQLSSFRFSKAQLAPKEIFDIRNQLLQVISRMGF